MIVWLKKRHLKEVCYFSWLVSLTSISTLFFHVFHLTSLHPLFVSFSFSLSLSLSSTAIKFLQREQSVDFILSSSSVSRQQQPRHFLVSLLFYNVLYLGNCVWFMSFYSRFLYERHICIQKYTKERKRTWNVSSYISQTSLSLLPSGNLVLERKGLSESLKENMQKVKKPRNFNATSSSDDLLSLVCSSSLVAPSSLSYSFIIFMFVIFVLKGGQDFQTFPVLSLESKLSLFKTFFFQIFRLIPEVASFLFHSLIPFFSFPSLDLLTLILIIIIKFHLLLSPLLSLSSLSSLSPSLFHSFCIRRSSSGKFLMPFHHFLWYLVSSLMEEITSVKFRRHRENLFFSQGVIHLHSAAGIFTDRNEEEVTNCLFSWYRSLSPSSSH